MAEPQTQPALSADPDGMPGAARSASSAWIDRLSAPIIIAAATTAVLMIFLQAWVADDAYITFRHVRNLLQGNGPVFNAGERVQGFSHPLWFIVLSVAGSVLPLRIAAIIGGLISTAAIVMLAGRGLQSKPHSLLSFLVVVGFLLSSATFVDYQTSGLETCLTHLLIVTLAFRVTAVESHRGRGEDASMHGRHSSVAWLCGLLLLNRFDLMFTTLPLLAYLAGDLIFGRRWKRLSQCLIAGLPLLGWLVFSTIYYGSPLPNTAYAKLEAFTRSDALRRGWLYVTDYAMHEPVHAALIVGALIATVALSVRRKARGDRDAVWVLCLAIGFVLQLAYVVAVGGDFMRGRFIAPALSGSAVLLAWIMGQWPPDRRPARTTTAILATALWGACAIGIGWFDPADTFAFGWTYLSEAMFLHPLIAAGAAIALMAMIVPAVRHLRRLSRADLAVGVFLAALAVQTALLIGVIGHFDPSPAVAGFAFVVLGAGSFLWARLTGGAPLNAAAPLLAATLLMAAASSLWNLLPRKTTINAAGIADEYAHYSGDWLEDRFSIPQKVLRNYYYLGDTARRYADAYGPYALEYGTMGFTPWGAGPQVTIIDHFGLTDAFIARCAPYGDSRVGHIEHQVPLDYLKCRGAVTTLPDWRRRMEELDPTLIADAKRMAAEHEWSDPVQQERWERVRRVVSGPIWDWERIKTIPWFFRPDRVSPRGELLERVPERF